MPLVISDSLSDMRCWSVTAVHLRLISGLVISKRFSIGSIMSVCTESFMYLTLFCSSALRHIGHMNVCMGVCASYLGGACVIPSCVLVFSHVDMLV